MSDELRFLLGLIITIMIVIWSAFFFIQYNDRIEFKKEQIRIENGYQWIPDVHGHWIKSK